LFGAATFFFIGAGVYWVAFSVAEATGFIAVLVKLFVYLILLFTPVQFAQAIDGLVVRPLIASASQGEGEREALAKRVR
jgi:hypothetical protein